MVDAVSTTAGSPICDCSNPDSCIHAVKVTPSGGTKTYEYKQKGAIPDIYVHDKDGKGAELAIDILGKGCVTGSSTCPSGVLFSEENESFLGELSKGSNPDIKLNYVDEVGKMASNYNIVDLISVIAFGDLKSAPSTKYDLYIGECGGYPISAKTFSTKSGKEASVEIGPIMSSTSSINVLPKYSYELGAKVSLGRDIKELTDNERRKARKESRLADGHNPNHAHTASSGWTTKVPGKSIGTSLDMDGFAKLTIGNDKKDFTADIVKKEFNQYKKKFSWLEKVEHTIGKAEKIVSVSSDQKVSVFSTEIMYPALKFSGSGKLCLSESTQQPYIQRTIGVELTPLVGIKVTFDILQAFGTYFGVGHLIAKAREELKRGKKRLEEGGSGVAGDIKLQIIVSGRLDLAFKFQSDEKKSYDFKLDNAASGELMIKPEANVYAAVKVWIIEGYFQAGADIEAKGKFALHEPKEGQLYLVLFHDGIVAQAYAEAGLSVKQRDVSPSSSENRFKTDSDGNVLGENTKTTGARAQASNKGDLVRKKWVICKKLEMKNSDCKVRLI